MCVFGCMYLEYHSSSQNQIFFYVFNFKSVCPQVDVNKPQGVSSLRITEASRLQRRCLAIYGCVPKPNATSLTFIQYNADLFVKIFKVLVIFFKFRLCNAHARLHVCVPDASGMH